MAYTPPTTFADGTTLTAANLEGNSEALRVYLHQGIIAGDFEASNGLTPGTFRRRSTTPSRAYSTGSRATRAASGREAPASGCSSPPRR